MLRSIRLVSGTIYLRQKISYAWECRRHKAPEALLVMIAEIHKGKSIEVVEASHMRSASFY